MDLIFSLQDTCAVEPQILFLEGNTMFDRLDRKSQVFVHKGSKDEWHVGLLPRSAPQVRLSPIILICISQSATDFRLIGIFEVVSTRSGYVHRESIFNDSQLTGSQVLGGPCMQPYRAHTLTTA